MDTQDLTGQTLGQYELRELLGTGGMGAVYKGYQASLGRYVAVKVLAAHLVSQMGALERFNREAQISAALEHPNIIPIHDYGTQHGISYLVLKLLTGGSLAERLEQSGGKLPSLGEIAALLKALSSALDYAHSQGVVHRDIKPSNVMFDNHAQPYFVDFGIAKLVESTVGGLTASGTVIGTWGYMAPEQWRAEEMSGAADQYALAIMTYALITGCMPFDAPTPAAIMHKHLNEMPTPPHNLRPTVPKAVTAVLERALAKDARQRFPTCTAFAQTFDGAIRGSTGPTTQFFTAPIKRKPPRVPASGSQPSRAYAEPPTVTQPFYKSRAAWAMIALIVALIAVIIVMASGVLSGGGETDTTAPAPTLAAGGPTLTLTDSVLVVIPPTDALEPGVTDTFALSETPQPTSTVTEKPRATETQPVVVVVPTQTDTLTATATATATLPPSATPTPDEQATLQAAMALLQTENAQTAVAALTQTATQWTLTPTPDIKATAAALLTQTQVALNAQATLDASATAAQVSRNHTATATLWTFTPTATWTPSLTPTETPTATQTSTLTPTPDLVIRAQTPVARNADWGPLIQEFDGVAMVLVPAGCFMMGSEDGASNERPVHEVCFEEPFWIGKTEVTNAQYKQCVEAGGCTAPRDTRYYDDAQYADHPAVYVDWNQASAYAAWRGDMIGAKVRLPTEAQWEYAARGPDGVMYAWGNDDPTCALANIAGCAGDTSPVGSYPTGASWVGALDMIGNVWEWVADWYGAYAAERQVNPTGPSSGAFRVVRGGSWFSNRDLARAAFRLRSYPDFRDFNLGFRVVFVPHL